MQFVFSNHILDLGRRELRRGSEAIDVEPQVFDLLVYLMQNRERVVSKDDLIASVWGGRIVSDSTLTSRINAARKAVGDNGEEQRLIRTIARKGLRFVGEVESAGGTQEANREIVAGGAPVAGPSGDCGLAVQQYDRRSGSGIFLRRHQRRHHHRIVQAALVFRHRPQFLFHLQGPGGPYEADRRGARRRLCRRRQRAQGRRPRPHYRAAQ